jgi:acetoin utilization protein AcuB
MRVGAWMTSTVITIKPDASLRDAGKLMKGCHVRHLPVVQGGNLVGLVTDRDLNAAYPSPATSLSVAEIQAAWGQIPIAAVMRRQVIAVAPRTPLAEAARLMRDHKLEALLVLKGGEVVGIVTVSALLEALEILVNQAQEGLASTVA